MILSRRAVLFALPAATLLPHAPFAQTRPQLHARGLHSMSLAVTDVRRSLEFYQGLFGMTVQARRGETPLLQVGAGPKFMALTPVAANGTPGVIRFGIAVEDFNVDRIIAALAAHGVTRTAAGAADGAPDGPMKVRVAMRDRTAEVFLSDPSGIICQLQDPTNCGGSGPLGNSCLAVQPSPRKGLIALQDYSHFTIAAASADESN